MTLFEQSETFTGMDLEEAVMLVIQDAARVVLPGERTNIVSRIRRDFAKHGHCEHALIHRIEEILRARLAQ